MLAIAAGAEEPQLERLLTVQEAAELEGVCDKWFRDGVNKQGWPHYRIAGRLKFSLKQIAEIRELHRRDAEERGARRVARSPRRRSRARATA